MNSFDERERTLAKYVALGYTPQQIAERCGVTAKLVRERLKSPPFQELVGREMERVASRVEDEVVENLAEAAKLASRQLVVALRSKDRATLRWAIEYALDRKLGKPTEKVQQATLNLNKPLGEALQGALSDPGVRRWVEMERPELRALLGAAPQPYEAEALKVVPPAPAEPPTEEEK